MKNKVPELSIFFPFWNEEQNIEHVVLDAIPVAKQVAEKWEIVMVDDGSSDQTVAVCKRLAKEDPARLRVVSHTPNRGYGAALKDGFNAAKYNLVVFNDGDRQFDFSEVDRFLAKIDDADIVIGYRKKRRDNFVRHILMSLLKVWDFVFFGFYFRDIDCGFKMFRKEALQKLLPLNAEGAMITTEILAKAKLKGLKIAQVEVSHFPRTWGDQSGANIYIIIRSILETFVLWWDILNGRYR